ncbi:LuxR family transcriptional regulator [Streptomyces sp. DH24]|uniref:LuxR family transcriptional regulator n=1 Tax=Streptomyces sp. DH24 TaxID=3040123 RepID=UPI0024432559|nr:LuxR family transcriptional regulator [Streptomyces sp. DH24]MDG9719008.1 LuxR family transcriptional regulator [Streptomyces sp. DH24]
MTTFEQDAKTLPPPWPFTGREDERELVRRSLAAGRQGIVVTGPAGSGKTRLVTEAVRGTDCARAAGTPEARHIPFAAFAHLLPESVTLHRAVRLLSGVRLLLVDDAHLLDDASAALVHQLAVQGRTRLVVVATDGAAAPGAITRLWTGELLPRLALETLPREETAHLLTAGAGREPEPLTAHRLHSLCRGDLRLLRALLDAVRERGLLTRVSGTDEWAWRGPVPVTAAVRDRTAHVLDRTAPGEREILDRLAFAEPLPLGIRDFQHSQGFQHFQSLQHSQGLQDFGAGESASGAGDFVVPLRPEGVEADGPRPADPADSALSADPAVRADGDLGWGPATSAAVRSLPRPGDGGGPALRTLERLEADGLVHVDEHGAVRLAHPLYGPALRATAGRLRARRLTGSADRCRPALDAEAAALEEAIARADVRHTRTPVGEWLAAEGADPVPAGYAAVRARFARLRGELKEAAAWAREGLRGAGDDPACRTELAAAASESGGLATVRETGGAEALTDGFYDDFHDGLCDDPYDAVRRGVPARAGARLTGVFAVHAEALARGDGAALDRAARALEERGFLLFAAEAYAQAAGVHRDPSAARTSRTRAAALARRCQGARTPALSGLVLGELTARQRQIVTLAAAGLSNRQIAERLTLSVRTVGNHLYSAYTRLGSADRRALPWLIRLPDTQPA